MLPRLIAEERLRTITDGALAAGSMSARDQRKAIGAIEEMAGRERRKIAKANPAALASMGIAVRAPSAAFEKELGDVGR